MALQYHHQGSSEKQQRAYQGFPGEGFSEEQGREDDGQHQAAFVDRDDFGDIPVLDGVEITELGCACGQS